MVNVSPAAPYTEDGFTITPTTNQSAVFDSAAAVSMLGNNTDWFGFEENNLPTLTLTAGGVHFDIATVLIGPSNIASAIPINMTIVGNLFAGGSVSSTFNDLNTATLAVLNWNNLASVDFLATDGAGLDNTVVNAVPESSTLALMVIGLVGIGYQQYHRKKAAK